MRKSTIVAASIIGVLASSGAYFGPRLYTLTTVGAGYTAKVICSCLYVAGRSADSCARDLEPPAPSLVKWTAADGRVRASTLGLAHATARYDAGYGCALEE